MNNVSLILESLLMLMLKLMLMLMLLLLHVLHIKGICRSHFNQLTIIYLESRS